MAGKKSRGSKKSKPATPRISADEVIARILEILDLFPELAEEVPKSYRKERFWKDTFNANADSQRMLELLRELPAFTNLAPGSRTKASWRRVLAPPYGVGRVVALLTQTVAFARKKPRPRKRIRYWRDAFGPDETIQRVRPEESDDYIPNPHRGTTTFQRFQGNDTYPAYFTSDTHGPVEFKPVGKVRDNAKYIPRTTLTYCRWPWKWLEPEKGKYNWKLIDGTLKTARERGQTAQIRFQPYTRRVEYSKEPVKARRHPPEKSVNVPDWYWDTGAGWVKSGVYAPHEPDSNEPRYIKHFGDFIRAFAERYDGHPDLESVDVAYAGFWGESGGNTTAATAARLTDIYLRSFRKTQLLSMLGTHGCTHASKKTGNTKRHIGWRADCFGDLHLGDSPNVPPELSWNHTYDAYPKQIELCGVKDAWKAAPVTMETCGNVSTWYMRGYDLDRIIEEGYKYHMSVFMPKNVFFPEAVMDRLVEFDRKIGYRFVLRQLLLPLEAKPGDEIPLQFFIDNVGCAPIYRPYGLAVRFRQGKKGRVVRLKEDIRGWLPGHRWFQEKLAVPRSLARGEAKVDLGVVDESDTPKVWFAAKELTPDGWHPMTSIDVVR